jgi:hypothetical protein
MISSFFALAAQSPSRQGAFRRTVVIHLVTLALGLWVIDRLTGSVWPALPRTPAATTAAALLGDLLLIAGIVEGAALVGWRLTQLPKSQALEFLLVTPLRPARVLLAEAGVGLARLGLVTLAGLPLLVPLTFGGCLNVIDLGPLLVMPFTWGAITGLGLTTWAYEPLTARRWVERGTLLLIVIYLLIGVFAGEHLKTWLSFLPRFLERGFLVSFEGFHVYNPFAVLSSWLTQEAGVPLIWNNRNLGVVASAWERGLMVEACALAVLGLCLVRSAARLHGHFQDRHYRPHAVDEGSARGQIGDRPLSWWAVRRVTEYSGRINLWLASAFGLVYAAYTVLAAANAWPDWLGRRVFEVCDGVGGVPAFASALVVLAAVPAAFQYGLWDSNTQDRCRRLELLLLTELGPRDYWAASTAAAWRRGRGYFATAVLLWVASAWAALVPAVRQAGGEDLWRTVRQTHHVPWSQLEGVVRETFVLAGPRPGLQFLGAVAAGILLWCFCFTLSFRAFSRGVHSNGLGALLTLGLPLLTLVLNWSGWPVLAGLLPPGSVHALAVRPPGLVWLIGPTITGVVTLLVARVALAHCDRELRRWYDLHHGQKVLD